MSTVTGSCTIFTTKAVRFNLPALFCASLIVCVCASPNLLAEQTPSDAPAPKGNEQEIIKKSQLNELLNKMKQPADADIEMLPQPVQTPEQAEKTEKSRKATALFMAGRQQEHARKFKEAYQSYLQAIETDPNSLYLYRAIIPLAFRLEKIEQAIEFAKKAVEIDPNNFELLSQLGLYALRQQNVLGSIDYFEKAVKSSTVDKKSGTYITIMSQLGQLYLAIGQNEKAAQTYLVVYHAITKPNDFTLDIRTQRAVETFRGDKATTLESLGELFLLTEKLNEAQDCFERATKATRKSPANYSYQLARVLNKRKQFEPAIEKLQEYFNAKLTTKGKGPYLLYAELLVATDKKDDIIPALEKLSGNDPQNEELKIYLTDQLLDHGQIEKAEKILLSLLNGKHKGNAHLGLLKISRLRKNASETFNELTLAMLNGASADRLIAERELIGQDEELLNKILEIGEKESVKAKDTRERFARFYQLAKIAMLPKNYEKTKYFFDQAIKLKTKDRITLKKLYDEMVVYFNAEHQYKHSISTLREAIASRYLAQYRRDYQLKLIKAYVFDEQPKEAIEVVKTARATNPTNIEWDYQEAWVHYSSKKWEDAIKLYVPLLDRAVKENNASKVRTIRFDLSRCLAFVGMAEKAIELLDQTIAEEPEETLWMFQKGWVYYYSKQWTSAIKAYQTILKQDTDKQNPALIKQTKFSLSAAFVQNKQFREGEMILEKIYEENPDDTSTCNDLGYLYADQNKKLEQAEKMIQKSLDAEPENNAYIDSMGWVKYRLGKYEEAKKLLEQAVEGSESGDAVLWEHLGDCYDKLNMKEKAIEAWKKGTQHESKATYPDQELIKKIEAKLK